jgi:histidinol-phosphate/aromatic aminotransferase/cobyric acid decarboxylase-like protein
VLAFQETIFYTTSITRTSRWWILRFHWGCRVGNDYDKGKHQYIVHPNNVTGKFTMKEQCPVMPGVTIIDEAYMDYYPNDRSFINSIHSGAERMVVVRTLSKYYALAGNRVGYAICTPDIAEYLRKAEMPYCISQHALTNAIHAFSGARESQYEFARMKMEQARDVLYHGLCKLNVRTMEPCANFISAYVPDVPGFATRDFVPVWIAPYWDSQDNGGSI